MKKNKKNKLKNSTYPSYYLAICLGLLLIVEFTAFSGTTSDDWKKGFTVLDMSQGFNETYRDVTETLQPMIDVAVGVDIFYQMAADETIDLFENNTYEDSVSIFTGVNEFYEEASRQMAIVLDLSGTSLWPSQVAGAFVETNSP